MIILKDSKYMNKINSNYKCQSPNAQSMSNDKCLKKPALIIQIYGILAIRKWKENK